MEKTYKLNKFFNPWAYRDLAIVALAFLMYSIFSKTFQLSFLRALGFICLVLMFGKFKHMTDSISAKGEALEFVDHVPMKPESRGFVRTRGIWWWVKVSYRVTEVKVLEFRQCFVEKMFDVGHIRFSGNVEYEADRSQHRITPKKIFVIYGIKNFALFKSDFCRNVK